VVLLNGRVLGIAMHVLASCFHAPMMSVSRYSRIRWLPGLRPRLPDDAEESLDIDRLGKMVIETGSIYPYRLLHSSSPVSMGLSFRTQSARIWARSRQGLVCYLDYLGT
jgi:hypothetical protein